MPPPSSTLAMFTDKKLLIGGALGALLAGGGASAYFNAETLENVRFQFKINHRWGLLLLAAGVGLVVGFGYSIYHNNWKLPIPKPVVKDGTFAFERWGFLDEAMTALVFAVLAALAKFPSAGPYEFSESSAALLIGAAIAGARMRSGIADRNILHDSLVQAVKAPASPGRAAAVEEAATSRDAALAAIGEVPITLPDALRSRFDPKALRQRLEAHGRAVTNNGDGLTLETLAQYQVLQPAVQPFVRDMRLPVVAAMSGPDFLNAVADNGLNVGNNPVGLLALHQASVDSMKALQALPAEWTLSK